jgi:plastocyanin
METTPKPMGAPAAKPKNRNLIMIGIVIIVLIVVGVGVYAYVNSGSTTPQGTKLTMWDVGSVCTSTAQCGFKDLTSGNANTTITAGTTVYWANTGKASHSATSCDPTNAATAGTTGCPITNASNLPAFDTSVIAPGTNSKSITFTTAGTYYYFCTVHAFMHGKIVVQ